MTTGAEVLTRPVLADLLPGARVRDAGLVAAGAGVTGIAAQFAIHTPLSPVPFTLQTLSVLLVGATLGPGRSVLSMLLYLGVGCAGVPWFADASSGWANGPSFGYLVAFVAAAPAAGVLARRGADRHILGTVALMAIGNVIVYAIGAGWLAVNLHLSLARAWDLGVSPFLITDALKIAVAVIALPVAWRLACR